MRRILVGRMADALGERAGMCVRVADGRIVGLESWNDATTPEPDDLDARDALLVPGFIDIHVHGGVGRYVMEGTADALDTIAVHLASHGVTGFLATTVTGPWAQQAQALATTAARMRQQQSGAEAFSQDTDGNRPPRAQVLGCHLEGPYINPKKKGAQPEQYVREPNIEELRHWCGDNLQAVRVVTLAPEMPGGLEMTRFLAEQGILPSIGHTDATYAQMEAAIDAGARHVTHCFNAMRAMEGREPGVVGAALARPELTAELIWDNIHVHPASCRALINAKGAEGIILISDGIPGAGMGEDYAFSVGRFEHSGEGRLGASAGWNPCRQPVDAGTRVCQRHTIFTFRTRPHDLLQCRLCLRPRPSQRLAAPRLRRRPHAAECGRQREVYVYFRVELKFIRFDLKAYLAQDVGGAFAGVGGTGIGNGSAALVRFQHDLFAARGVVSCGFLQLRADLIKTVKIVVVEDDHIGAIVVSRILLVTSRQNALFDKGFGYFHIGGHC